jgi:ABC-type transport system involved in cytochrome c biogenesis permease component
VSKINSSPPSSCFSGAACQLNVGINTNGVDLIFSVVALALLFPVLIFTATAVLGTVAGFGLFFVFRPPLAAIPWTGGPAVPG